MKTDRPWKIERRDPFGADRDDDASFEPDSGEWHTLASFETEAERDTAYREALAVSVAPLRVREAK